MAEDQNTDFEFAEEREARKQLNLLEGQAHEGALFLDWKNSFCTRKLLVWIDEQIQDSKNGWLACKNREDAEAIRLQAQSFTKTKNWILSQIKAGEIASVGIKKFHDQGIELEGLIKPPTGEGSR